MRANRRFAVALAVLAAGSLGARAAPPAAERGKVAVFRKGQTRIMPLGDSITNAAGWRVYLQDLLKKDGYTFRMVGGRNDPLLPEGYWSDHGGCGGWAIGSFPFSQEFGGADVDWVGSRPDLVLLMIGTNDMQWGHGEGAGERLGGLLDKIRKDLPDAIILVAQITPFAPGSRVNDRKDGPLLDKEVATYNAAIKELVGARAKAGQRVGLVDQHTGFDPAKDLADKCHPNEAGHRKMAQKWLDAIRAVTVKENDYPERALPPIVRAAAAAGAPKVIAAGEKVRLTGALEDAGGQGLKVSYAWRKLCGPGDVTFDAPHDLTTTARFPKAGSYCLALTAGNGKAERRGDVQVVVKNPSGEGDDAKPGKAGRAIGIALGTALRADDAAGVVPRPHWNAAKLRDSTPVRLNNLLDDKGKATTASYRFWSNGGVAASNSGVPDTPDGRLLGSRPAGNNFVSQRIHDIPFAHYDLYLYFYQAPARDAKGADVIHRLQVRDLDTDRTIIGPLYAKNLSGPFEKWVRLATNQTSDRKEAAPEANYVLIPDLAVQNVEILSAAGSSLCGLQIVERLDTDK